MILVTGATGLVGRFAIAELARRGHAVRALCRRAVHIPGAEVVLGDLRDPDSIATAARGVTGIVHAACTLTDSAVDIAAMQALIASWQRGTFVFVSSLDVYGLVDGGPITEDAPVTEDFNDYARGKVVCERLLAAARRPDHVALRAPLIWGPHPSARRRLVGDRLLAHRPIVLPGTDPAEWSRYQDAWIDARDLAVIIARSLDRPAGGPLNVLTGHFSWDALYAELIDVTGSHSEIVHVPLASITDDQLPHRDLYARTWQFSESRLARHLGVIPRRSLSTTVRETVACTVSVD